MQLLKDCFFLLFIAPACLLGAERLTLSRVIDEAVARNAAVLAEKTNISIAEAKIITAQLRPNPVMNVTSNHLDWLGTGFNDQNGGGPSEFTVHTDFIWERGGKRQARVAEAKSASTVAEWQFRNVLRETILEIQNAFVEVLLAHEGLALMEKNIAFFHQISEINAVRLKAGDISTVEYTRSQLAELQYENLLFQSRSKLRGSLIQLQAKMGRTALDPSLEIDGEFRSDPQLPSQAEVLQYALANRPDLQAARADAERAQAECKVQQAEKKVDFTWGTEYTRQFDTAQAQALGLSVNMQLPFFNRNQGEIARAEAEKKQADLRVVAQKTIVSGDIEMAYQQVTTAKALLENIGKKMLAQAQEVRDTTQFSYIHGSASLLELLDAQRTFNETMQAYNEARAEYSKCLFLLDSAAGKETTK